MNDNLDVLLPVYNEAKSISKLIPEIHNNINEKINYTIIVCEDGSTDNTLEVIESFKDKYPIKLITSKNRKGYSIAVLDGIKAATADYLLIMDSDGQSNPEEIINFWKNRKKANLINGNRVIRKDYMYRKFYSKLALFIYRLLFSIPLKDPSYAYLIMEKKVFLSLNNFKPLMPDGFFWEFNARAKKLGLTFYNLNVTHNNRYYGETKIYHWLKLPWVSYKNFIGMIKIKFLN